MSIKPFTPPWWAKNRHVQTIWPRFFQRRKPLSYWQEQLELPDGDFVMVNWGEKPESPRGMVVLFHGLEGSIKSHYANDMMAHLRSQNWWPVLMHFRSCGGVLNRLPRAYHSGDTADAWFFLQELQQRWPEIPKYGIGFSLGANMLLKLLGEQGQQDTLQAAVAISPPFDLAICSDSINQGFSRAYQGYLLSSMCKSLKQKMQLMDFSEAIALKPEQISELKNFRDFDHRVTAPLHGFDGADDYYQRCSAKGFIGQIQTPSLILHALDDPFMAPDIVPDAGTLPDCVTLEVSEKGGHVGFLQGTPWKPKIWLHQRVSQFLTSVEAPLSSAPMAETL